MKNKLRQVLSNKTRELMHSVINENIGLVPIMHQLTHYRDCDKVLLWLFKNKITGNCLLDWIKIYHKNSIMSMVKFIIKSNNNNREEKPIMLGKDWIK